MEYDEEEGDVDPSEADDAAQKGDLDGDADGGESHHDKTRAGVRFGVMEVRHRSEHRWRLGSGRVQGCRQPGHEDGTDPSR